MTVLTINGSDTRGGAATVAWNLFEQYDQIGLSSWYAVQHKFSNHDQVITVDNEAYFNLWRNFFSGLRRSLLSRKGYGKTAWRLAKLCGWIADPAGSIRLELGIEEFNFKGSRKILSRIPDYPDIVHAHVLHGGFFDLRYLKSLSNKIPVFFTFHDAWMLSGHCAHSFDCDRWKYGCGKCPDLSIPHPIKRDSSAFNWKRKRNIYKGSKFYIATPCQWLMDKVEQSILAEACIESKVIPYGVNHNVFFPSDRMESRKLLGIDEGAFVFLFSANGIQRNRWKDFELMKNALKIVSQEKLDKKIIFLALGEQAKPEQLGNAEIRFMPYRSDTKSVAAFYSAADVYLHASKVDTFPNAVLEALSCGTPVIGTDVGGIPEQIKGWKGIDLTNAALNRYGLNEATGILISSGDADSFARAMRTLMLDEPTRIQLGVNAARDAKIRFSMKKQIDTYLEWYRDVLQKRN